MSLSLLLITRCVWLSWIFRSSPHTHTHTHAPTWETRGRERGREMRQRKTCTEFRKLYRAALRGPRASAVNVERRMSQRIFAVSHATSLEAACPSHSLSSALSLSLFLLSVCACTHFQQAGKDSPEEVETPLALPVQVVYFRSTRFDVFSLLLLAFRSPSRPSSSFV